ncbi:MAG: DUF3781 domain-containing protein [Helicobacteraceae bacterium]|nr:DUF3781 domain-containing protein [Helicobacteraceae bacterium]
MDWIERIHTTELGERRIRRNLDLTADNVVAWLKCALLAANKDLFIRKGKNWYAYGEWFVLVVNASTYTIITAHKRSSLAARKLSFLDFNRKGT